MVIQAETASELTIGTLRKPESDEDDPHTFMTRNLKAGVSVSDHITMNSSARFYSFKLSLPMHVEAISINIVPKSGKFHITARNDGMTPEVHQGYWTSPSNELLIDRDDPKFSLNKRYVIAVVPIINQDNLDLFESEGFYYDIKFSYTDKHSILSPGVPEYGTLHGESQCFVIQNFDSSEGVYIGKSIVTRSLNMFINIGGDNFKPSIEDYDYLVNTEEVGTFIPSQKIHEICKKRINSLKEQENLKGGNLPQKCHIYACLRGNRRDRYSIYYKQKNNIIRGTEGSILNLPVPQAGSLIHLIYYPNPYKDLYIEESGLNRKVELMTNCVGKDKVHRGMQYPTEAKNQKKSQPTFYSRGIFYESEELKKLKNPICFITIQSNLKCKSKETKSPYCDQEHIALQFTTDLKEINKNTPTQMIVPYHDVQYVYFYNSDPDIPISVEISTEGNDRVAAFLGVGKESRPTYGKNLKQVWHWSSLPSKMEIREELVKERGYKDLRNYYVVGISSMSKPVSKVTVTWNHGDQALQYLTQGVTHHITLTNKKDFHAEFRSARAQQGFDIVVFGKDSTFRIMYKEQKMNQQVSVNTKDLFPTNEEFDGIFFMNFKMNYQIFRIPSNQSEKMARYLFTIQSTSEFSEFDILIRPRGGRNFIWGSNEYIDIQESDFNNPHNFTSTFTDQSYLQLDISKEATLEISPFVRNPKMEDAKQKRTLKLQKGYNFINIKKELGKTQNSGRMLFDIMRVFKRFSHSISAYQRDNFSVHCKSRCMYKMSVVHPERENFIKMNAFTQGIIPTGVDSMKYAFNIRDTESLKKLTVRVRILRAYKKQGSTIEYVPFDINGAEARKMIKIQHVDLDMAHRYNRFVQMKYNSLDNLPMQIRENEVYILIHPRSGRYKVEISSIMGLDIKYELEVSNSPYLDVRDGSSLVDRLPLHFPKDEEMKRTKHGEKAHTILDKSRLVGSKTYVYQNEEPGKLRISLDRCFGSLGLEIESETSVYIEANVQERRIVREIDMIDLGPHYIKVEGGHDSLFERFEEVIDEEKHVNIYNLRIERVKTEDPFEGINPGRIGMSFSGSKPILKFQDLEIPEYQLAKYNYQIKYTVVTTDIPELLHYYNGCNAIYLEGLFKKHFRKKLFGRYLSVQGLAQIRSSNKFAGKNVRIPKGVSWMKVKGLEHEQIELKVKPGERYHTSVFADIIATPKAFEISRDFQAYFDKDQTSKRLHYKTIRFDTSTFETPIEIIGALLGLVAIAIASLMLVGRTVTSFIGKISGFQTLRSGPSGDLETYFLDMKKKGDMLEAGETIPEENTEGEYAVEDVKSSNKVKKETELQASVGANEEQTEDSKAEEPVDIEKQIAEAQKRYESPE